MEQQLLFADMYKWCEWCRGLDCGTEIINEQLFHIGCTTGFKYLCQETDHR